MLGNLSYMNLYLPQFLVHRCSVAHTETYIFYCYALCEHLKYA